jgi:hypothetical protein
MKIRLACRFVRSNIALNEQFIVIYYSQSASRESRSRLRVHPILMGMLELQTPQRDTKYQNGHFETTCCAHWTVDAQRRE